VTATSNAIKLANIAANAASEKIAENIVALDVSDLMALTDIFLLASGRNERQVASIADVMHEEDRMYYSLERLWKDSPVVKLEVPAN
jgi:ribosome-associated protein